MANGNPLEPAKSNGNAFRAAVVRGLGVLAPPLLTFLIFIWAGNTVNEFVIRPVVSVARNGLVWATADIRTEVPKHDPLVRLVPVGDRMFYRTDDGKYVPLEVYDAVRLADPDEPPPRTATEVYRRYVALRYLQSYLVIPFLLSIFILALYLVGKFMAAGIGRFLWHIFELAISRLPLVRNVYSAVKQVSDFMFTEREFTFNRVVALEYPRKGIWSMGFVTNEGFLDIRAAANEPVLTVFIPCSPMPISGFTVSCLKSECIDLNMTLDQACQFMISCGVVIPPHQLPSPAPAAKISPDASPAVEGTDGICSPELSANP